MKCHCILSTDIEDDVEVPDNTENPEQDAKGEFWDIIEDLIYDEIKCICGGD